MPSGLNAEPGAVAELPGRDGAAALPHSAPGCPVVVGPFICVEPAPGVGAWLVGGVAGLEVTGSAIAAAAINRMTFLMAKLLDGRASGRVTGRLLH